MIFALTLAAIALPATVLAGYPFVEALRRQNVGKEISEWGPETHQVKAGTPTMGGLLIVLSIAVFTVSANLVGRWSVGLPLLTMGCLALLGFVDDLGSLQGREQRALTRRVKLVAFIAIGVGAAFGLYHYLELHAVNIPYDGRHDIDWVYIPIAVVVIVLTAGGVAVTDGLDGLVAGTGAIAFGAYGFIALYQDQTYLGAFCLTVVAALLGFLWHNAYPARVFMGDTGALALGGALAVVAFMTGQWLVLPLIGVSLRHRWAVRGAPGRLLPPDRRQAPVQDGPCPPPFREDRLERGTGHAALLGRPGSRRDRRHRAGAGGVQVIDLKQLDRLDFAGKNVTVVGLGIEGVDFVRFLTRRGANVTISDSKPQDKLADRLSDVAGLSVNLSLGGNDNAAVTEADAVFVSQCVPLDLPAIRQARQRGIPLHSMVGLFLELAPGPVVGITGSSGKTTTTALIAEMLRADERPVFVGGNIGVGLLEHVSALRPYTWSVLEVSHTQLQLVDHSPHIAAVLNITPNHLDRFSWEDYKTLKGNLIRYQAAEDIAILGYDDPETRALQSEVRGRLLWFTMDSKLRGEGVFVRDGVAIARLDGREEPLFALDTVAIRGRHNQENAVAAAAIAIACGLTRDAIATAVAGFRGVPHRLEFVGEVDGAKYYNDSIATTPERALAGLRSFAEPIVLLLGGRDKQLPLDEMAAEALRRCRGIVLFGESADLLQEALNRQPNPRSVPVVRDETLEEAVASAHEMARPGDVVLLSPSCTSYDAYENFERRGEHFRELVAEVRP